MLAQKTWFADFKQAKFLSLIREKILHFFASPPSSTAFYSKGLLSRSEYPCLLTLPIITSTGTRLVCKAFRIGGRIKWRKLCFQIVFGKGAEKVLGTNVSLPLLKMPLRDTFLSSHCNQSPEHLFLKCLEGLQAPKEIQY